MKKKKEDIKDTEIKENSWERISEKVILVDKKPRGFRPKSPSGEVTNHKRIFKKYEYRYVPHLDAVLTWSLFKKLEGASKVYRMKEQWKTYKIVEPSFDSTQTVVEHIHLVQKYLNECVQKLEFRANVHDVTKLGKEEKQLFDLLTPILKIAPLGTPLYERSRDALKVSLLHHYRHNSHHPEHYRAGVLGMDLFDLMEMLCDWKAANDRSLNNGGQLSYIQSFDVLKKRFNIPKPLERILMNHIKRHFDQPVNIITPETSEEKLIRIEKEKERKLEIKREIENYGYRNENRIQQ